MIPRLTTSQPAGLSELFVYVPPVMVHLDQTFLSSCCYHPETGGDFPCQSHGLAKDFIKRHCPGPISTSVSPVPPHPQTCPPLAMHPAVSKAGQDCTRADAGQRWQMQRSKAASEGGEHAPVTCPQASGQPGTGQGHQVPHMNATSPNATVGIQRLCATLCSGKTPPCPLQGALREFIHSKNYSYLSHQSHRAQRAICQCPI